MEDNKTRKYDDKKSVDRKTKNQWRGKKQYHGTPERRSENDISWYMSTPELIDQAGKVAFVNPLGSRLERAIRSEFASQLEDRLPLELSDYTDLDTAVPGIFRIMLSPSLGVSLDAASPLNVMARSFFATIQSTLNMKLAPAIEAPDLVCYMGAADSIFSFYSWVCRLYGTVANESILNKYVGKGLIKANWVDYDDLRAHLPQMLFYLKYFRKKVNEGITLPKGFGFAQRHFWLFGNYFKDSPVEKSQIYVHAPAGFYKWNPTKYDTGTALEFEPLHAYAENCYVMKWDEIAAYGDMLLNAMLQDQDANSISGFMLRGWGSEGCTMLPEVPDNYAVDPTYSEEILGQIHNATSVGIRVLPQIVEAESLHLDLDYRQQQEGDSWLFCHPRFSTTSPYDPVSGSLDGWEDAAYPIGLENVTGIELEPLMDSFVDAPTANEIIINSRNMMIGHYDVYLPDEVGTAVKSAYVDSCGLDIIWGYQVMTKDGEQYYIAEAATMVCDGGRTTPSPSSGKLISMLSKFDWAPRVLSAGTVVHSNLVEAFYLGCDSWDYNNTARVSSDALDKMHLAALNGAFGLKIRVNGYDKIVK